MKKIILVFLLLLSGCSLVDSTNTNIQLDELSSLYPVGLCLKISLDQATVENERLQNDSSCSIDNNVYFAHDFTRFKDDGIWVKEHIYYSDRIYNIMPTDEIIFNGTFEELDVQDENEIPVPIKLELSGTIYINAFLANDKNIYFNDYVMYAPDLTTQTYTYVQNIDTKSLTSTDPNNAGIAHSAHYTHDNLYDMTYHISFKREQSVQSIDILKLNSDGEVVDSYTNYHEDTFIMEEGYHYIVKGHSQIETTTQVFGKQGTYEYFTGDDLVLKMKTIEFISE